MNPLAGPAPQSRTPLIADPYLWEFADEATLNLMVQLRCAAIRSWVTDHAPARLAAQDVLREQPRLAWGWTDAWIQVGTWCGFPNGPSKLPGQPGETCSSTLATLTRLENGGLRLALHGHWLVEAMSSGQNEQLAWLLAAGIDAAEERVGFWPSDTPDDHPKVISAWGFVSSVWHCSTADHDQEFDIIREDLKESVRLLLQHQWSLDAPAILGRAVWPDLEAHQEPGRVLTRRQVLAAEQPERLAQWVADLELLPALAPAAASGRSRL
jgi:hypothetical protein